MAEPLTVALVQMSCGDDPSANLEKALGRIAEAARAGAGIVCLPELFRTRYFCQSEEVARFALAEPVPGPTTEALGKAAAAHRAVVVAGVFERRGEGVYHNSAVILDADGRLAGHYRKMHIPDDPLYYEKFYFAPGDLGFPAFDTRRGRIAVLVCWDQWYPEAARLAALRGARILFYPTAIGWKPEEPEAAREMREAWETVQRGHAIANGAFVAAVNRSGEEGPIRFWGSSFVADPMGNVTAKAGEGEEILYANLDLSRVEETRQHWPFLRDRRIDAYEGITARFL